MTETLLATLLAGIQLWTKHEDNVPYKDKKKLADLALDLKREWYDEYTKPLAIRSDDRMARIELELRLLACRWAASVRDAAIANLEG